MKNMGLDFNLGFWAWRPNYESQFDFHSLVFFFFSGPAHFSFFLTSCFFRTFSVSFLLLCKTERSTESLREQRPAAACAARWSTSGAIDGGDGLRWKTQCRLGFTATGLLRRREEIVRWCGVLTSSGLICSDGEGGSMWRRGAALLGMIDDGDGREPSDGE